MHDFSELIQSSTTFSLNALESGQNKAIEELQTSASTTSVKTLQIVQLQKAILAVGMLSMFEAVLQAESQGVDGFRAAAKALDAKGAVALKERFADLQLAINVLKHGRGRSYDELVEKAGYLPFKVKLPDKTFFNGGDVAEVQTLIEVDDAFVLLCAEVIHDVSLAIKSVG